MPQQQKKPSYNTLTKCCSLPNILFHLGGCELKRTIHQAYDKVAHSGFHSTTKQTAYIIAHLSYSKHYHSLKQLDKSSVSQIYFCLLFVWHFKIRMSCGAVYHELDSWQKRHAKQTCNWSMHSYIPVCVYARTHHAWRQEKRWRPQSVRPSAKCNE